MVALSRQILVLFLVLLQFAAPLVHAHVDNSNPMFGLHLHELESIQRQSNSQFIAAQDSLHVVQSAIVDLGAAIKLPKFSDDLTPVYVLHSGHLPLSTQYLVKTINFSPHPVFAFSDPFLYPYSTRAPPII